MKHVMMFIFLLLAICLQGQEGDGQSYVLPEVLVKDSTPGTTNIMEERIEERQLFPTLSGTRASIQSMGPLFSSYGEGQLANISWHGMRSASNGIYWQGISLNDALTGQLDISGVSLFLLGDKRSFSSFNSEEGLPGAQISFQPELTTGPPSYSTQLGLETGQYGYNEAYGSSSYTKKKFATKAKIAFLDNKNRYPYKERGKVKLMSHGSRRFYGSSFALTGTLKGHQLWDASAYWSVDDKDIPLRLFQSHSDAHYRSDRGMCAVGWKYLDDKKRAILRFSGLRMNSTYRDSSAGIDFAGAYNQWLSHASIASQNRYLDWKVNLRGRWTKALSTGFREQKSIGDVLASLSIGRRIGNSTPGLILSGRMTNRRSYLYTYVLSLRQQWRSTLNLKLTAGKYGRLPSFNERYWVPGGNPDLHPEHSYGSDIVMEITAMPHLRLRLQLFDRHIADFIQWLPTAGVFYATNIPAVWSRGADGMIRYEMVPRWHVESRFSYTKTTYTKTRLPNDQAVGKQLIYTPLFQGNNLIKKSSRKWEWLLQHHWSGKRFISSDNERYLPGYHRFDFSCAYIIHREKLHAKIGLSIDNVTDARYQEIEGWLLAGRLFRVNFSLQFHKNKHFNHQ